MTRALMGVAMVMWAALAVDGVARADIPPPEVEVCDGKAPNAPCGDGMRCQDATCSRATPDGAVEYACFKCVPGASEEPKASGGGCEAGAAGGGALALGVLLLGGVALGRRRRLA